MNTKIFPTLLAAAMLLLTGCPPAETTQQTVVYDPGAVINGVKWATRNVTGFRDFVADPIEHGGFYSYEEALRACPGGWELPSERQLDALRDTQKVILKWHDQPAGFSFTDRATGQSLFLPASGYRTVSGAVVRDEYLDAGYWSNEPYGGISGYFLPICDQYSDYVGRLIEDHADNDFSIRCVAAR